MAQPDDVDTHAEPSHFGVLGVPVRARASFFLVAFVLGFAPNDLARSVSWVAAVFVCILVHELGHALMARRFGQTVRIELVALGGWTVFHGSPLGLRQVSLVLLAGPGAGFLLGALVFPATEWFRPGSGTHVAIQDVLWISWGYGVLNLIPVVPLDGGQLVTQVLTRRFGEGGRLAAQIVGLTTVAALFALAIAERSPRAAFLLIWLAWARLGEVVPLVRSLLDLRHRGALQALREAGELEDGVKQLELSEALLPRLHSDRNRAWVAHVLAHALFLERRPAEAREAVMSVPPEFRAYTQMLEARIALALDDFDAAIEILRPRTEDPAARGWLVDALRRRGDVEEALRVADEGPLDHQGKHSREAALFYAGRFAESLRASAELFDESHCNTAAYNAGCSACRLGDLDDALQWLERSVDAGYRDWERLERDDDLAPLRERGDVQQLVTRIRALVE